jgi:hypothetical protein
MSTRIKRLTFEMLYGEVKSKILDYRKQCGRRGNITPWDYDQSVIIDPQKPQDF